MERFADISLQYKFASHSKEAFSVTTTEQLISAKRNTWRLRESYCGLPSTDARSFDTEPVNNVIADLKATGIEGLSAHRVFYYHLYLSIIISWKLFQLGLILIITCLPASDLGPNCVFPYSKSKEIYSRSLTYNDI